MKSIPAPWALLAGLLTVVAQVVTYNLRFGHWNTTATLTEYLFFFLAGSLGGSILIFFLNRQTAERGRRMVLGAFLLASPIALLMMLVGGVLGPLGLLIFPQIPWALFAWLGSLLGRVGARRQES
jgi:hypothetical protein